ncbi:hypothetical protein K488DRAFT_66177, partial [Vararia minispora EC-137]
PSLPSLAPDARPPYPAHGPVDRARRAPSPLAPIPRSRCPPTVSGTRTGVSCTPRAGTSCSHQPLQRCPPKPARTGQSCACTLCHRALPPALRAAMTLTPRICSSAGRSRRITHNLACTRTRLSRAHWHARRRNI